MSARELFAFNNRYFSAGVGVAAGRGVAFASPWMSTPASFAASFIGS